MKKIIASIPGSKVVLRFRLSLFFFLTVWGCPLGATQPPEVDHALYIAVIQLEHSPSQTVATITVKVFTDDLQSALRNANRQYVPVKAEQLCGASRQSIQQYFKDHLVLLINQKKYPLTLSSCEHENDVFLLRFDLKCPDKWKTVKVSADFLMELFPDQSNMVSIFNGEEKRFFRLTRQQPVQESIF